MAKVEKRLEADEVAARKQRDKDYQNRRKERLKELGEKKISIRLDSADYEKLSDLCESLGYRRPKPQMHNLIENYSSVLVYLLRIENMRQLYDPQSQAAKELYHLYKTVDHLKNDIGLSDSQIVEHFREGNIRTPLSTFVGNERTNWKKRHIKNLLNKDILLERLSILDEDE
ncbi:hypothetical protein AB6D34_12610 [Pectobacterium brasiliense]|uniref:Uncharacterized protein n=2 Tax=Pectobacterium brasiliense TaxID=180957 RepID=A0A3S0Y737_9GAMM|nr:MULTISPECIES: hypothetical protein [Pectobacterium]GKW29608.1 hypothetical protein PEC331060_27860 [Pectobacterium carotovorum subsp. carotovorum]MBN3045770.1 hypothetical protein [Pectobacterium brasiliense]MBN3076139.1 hypothetical protein [Pectobacterium brasiliense]MBN3086538.1 hypothetical protein [Pectobacterium brasiliense]MBN3090629.1 hypothetical protein [Pectobacterium brasiliense]